MSVNSILLFATTESASVDRGPVAFAIALAAAHRANLTILYVALDVTTPGRQGDPSANAKEIAAAARQAGIEPALIAGHSHAIGVHEVVAEHARHHDLVVAGCDNTGMLSERMVTEHVLFAGGRPLIVVPGDYSGGAPAGAVSVAWDNTRAAARALGDARPVIGDRPVTFLTIDRDKQVQADLSVDAIIAAAGRRGLQASAAAAARGSRSIAEALQQESLALGADLLVMGGKGHSALRRFVLGSATSGVLAGPRMPVLLSH
jgi:nucleotide-binding universal stress UspA family protein